MMKYKITFRLILIAMLAVWVTAPSLAQNSQSSEVPVETGTETGTANEAVNAPWFFDTVETFPPDPPTPAYDVGQHVSIALHPITGKPFISYFEGSHHMLKMAEYVGSGGNCGENNDWMCETIDHTGNVGMYNSIALDPWNGLPRISYYDETENALKIAIRTPFVWVLHTVHDTILTSVGMYSSLAVGSVSKSHIAYYLSNVTGYDSLWYAKYVGSGNGNCTYDAYACEQVDYGDRWGKYPSLALDSAERPHIAYYDQEHDALKYAHYDGAWYKRWILAPNAGKYADLVIDTNNGDKPHIAHYSDADTTLKYATFVGVGNGNCGPNQYIQDEWLCMDIANMGFNTESRGISIALDPAGYPMIAYQTGTSRLNIARPAVALGLVTGNCGVDPDTTLYAWQCEAITPIGFGFRQGDYLSLAVNSAGLSTIAYYGNVVGATGDLKVAYQRLQIFTPLIMRNTSQ